MRATCRRFGLRRPGAALLRSIQITKGRDTRGGPKRRQVGALQGVESAAHGRSGIIVTWNRTGLPRQILNPAGFSTASQSSYRFTWEDQLEWPSAYTALNTWREAIEGLGILVFQAGGIELEEMRGTGVTHGPLPVIVLNNSDAPHGRIFTLIHEFVHIMLANGGHITSAIEGRRQPEDQGLERASNRFAAATLLPAKQFLAEVEKYPDVLRGGNDALRRFANRTKVSAEVILRRLVTLQRVSIDLYREKRKEWQQRSWFTPPTGEGGPPIQVKVISSMGRSFVALVLEGYQRKAISSSDVSDYLGVKFTTG